MQAIKCELCGSNQLIKKDGYYQCEHCGTKYTLEEAKKLIVSGTVEVTKGEAEKERLLKNARYFLDNECWDKYEKIYDILQLDYPDDQRVTDLPHISSLTSDDYVGEFVEDIIYQLESKGVLKVDNNYCGLWSDLSKSQIAILAENGCLDYMPDVIKNKLSKEDIQRCKQLEQQKLQHKKEAEESLNRIKNLEQQSTYRMQNNLCKSCGGTFKGIFNKVCSKCGKPKDY